MAREVDPLDEIESQIEVTRTRAPGRPAPAPAAAADPLDEIEAQVEGARPAALYVEPPQKTIRIPPRVMPPPPPSQASVAFQPGPRTDGGARIPGGESAVQAAEIAGRVVQGIPEAITGPFAFANRLLAASVGPSLQHAQEAQQMRGQQEQAAAIGIPPERTQTTPLAPMHEDLADVAKEVGTGIQRRYIDQLQGDKIPVVGPAITALQKANPPAPGEAIGLERQAQEPWSVIFDAAMGAGAMATKAPPGYNTRVAADLGREGMRVTVENHAKAQTQAGGVRAAVWDSAAARSANAEAPPTSTVPYGPEKPLMTEPHGLELPTYGPELPRTRAERRAGLNPQTTQVAPFNTETAAIQERADRQAINTRKALERRQARNQWAPQPKLEPGDSATLVIGDNTIDLTPEHTLDPILLREANQAIEQSRSRRFTKPKIKPEPTGGGPEQPPALKRRPFTVPGKQPVGWAPRTPIPTTPKPATAKAVPTFFDSQTGERYAIRFTAEADQHPIEMARARSAKIRKDLGREKGAVDFGPVLDAMQEHARRVSDLLGGARDKGYSTALSGTAKVAGAIGKGAPLYRLAATSPAFKNLGEAMRAFGPNVGLPVARGAGNLAMKAIDVADTFRPGLREMADVTIGAARGLTIPVSRNLPHKATQIKNITEYDLGYQREPEYAKLVDHLERMHPDVGDALVREIVLDEPAVVAPKLRKQLADARREFMPLLDAQRRGLEADAVSHGRITPYTRDYGSRNYIPDWTRRESTDQTLDAHTERTNELKATLAGDRGGYTAGQTTTAPDRLARMEAESKGRMMANVVRSIRNRRLALDRLEILRGISMEPELSVPTKHLTDTLAKRVTQRNAIEAVEQTNPRAATLSDVLVDLNAKINDHNNAIRAELAKIGKPTTSHVRWTPEILRLQKELVPLQDAVERVAELHNELTNANQPTTFDAARKAITDGEADVQRRLMAAKAEATRRGFTPVAEMYRQAGRPYDIGAQRAMGALDGGYAHPAFADALDIFHPESPPDAVTSGLTQPFLALWSMAKTYYNPTSWGTNFFGSQGTAALGGYNPAAQLVYTPRALSRFLTDPNYIRDWIKDGVSVDHEFVSAKNRNDLARLSRDEKDPLFLKAAHRWLGDTGPSRVYRTLDTVVRLGMADHAVEVHGLSRAQAAREANKWVPEPKNTPPLLKKAQASTLGKWSLRPFLSIMAQQAPLVAEGAARRPIMFGAMAGLGALSSAFAVKTGAVTAEQMAKRMRWLGPGALDFSFTGEDGATRRSTLTLPIPVGEGEPIQVGMGNSNPALGMEPSQLINMVTGDSPARTIYDAATNARNPQTGKRSPDPTARAARQIGGPIVKAALDVGRSVNPEDRHRDRNKRPLTPGAVAAQLSPVPVQQATTRTLKIGQAAAFRDEMDQAIRELRANPTPEMKRATKEKIKASARRHGLRQSP